MQKKIISIILAFSLIFSLAGCGEKELPTHTEDGEYIVRDVTRDSSVTVSENDNHRVFYQIFVGSFSDSDGDGVGDLRGIINRLDYLNDGNPDSGESLGVEGIWLSPIFSSPSYHKYDVADYYAIDESFGTMEDLKELVKLCHERNIKIILDLVINHSSSQNPWFKEFCQAHKDGNTKSPAYDFYSWTDTPVSDHTFKKISGSEDYYECNFSSDMPELNYDNEIVKEEIVAVADYYLSSIGVDGFRFDAAKYIYYGEHDKNVEFWNWYMDELKAINPDIYTVAEVWDSDSVIYKYEDALNCFNFTLAQSDGKIAETARKGDVNTYTSYVEAYINKITGINEYAMIMPFIANHDMDRAAGYMQVSTGFAQVAANLYILGPGSPFIYYGEEIGMKGSRGSESTDANRRLAMRWGDGDTVESPDGANYDEKHQTNGYVTDQIGDENSILNYYKKLIMIRKANPEIYLGDYKALEFTDTKVGGFLTTLGNSYCAVIHNTTSSDKTVDLSSVTDLELTKINACIGFNNPEAILEGTRLTIPTQSSVVLR